MDTRSLVAASPSSTGESVGDICDIIASVGAVAYRWHIDSDDLAWSANAGSVLKIADMGTVSTGRAFAHLVVPGAAQSRHDAVMSSSLPDPGTGVPYQVQYAISPGTAATPLWIEDTGRWFGGQDGRPAYAHGILRVINERRAQHDRLAYLARFDELTGEINRYQLTDILSAALEEAIKSRSSIGFLVVSVDDLARINEAYGFAIGDEVIAACAKRLRAKMRGGDNFGRISGNKFGIVLAKCDSEELATAAERLLEAVRSDVVRTSVGPVTVTASIGGIIAPRHARTVRDVLSFSNEALNAGKHKRRGSVEMYRPDSERDALRRENIKATDEIIGALNERRILAAFEPVVEAQSRRPAFHECLLRVRRADGSLVVANDIMPIAERLGLVRLVDHRMLELTMDEMKAMPELHLSLNVSPSSINDAMWWNGLASALAGCPRIAERLTVEITESAAISDVEAARGFVGRLKDLGCRIAIDDFGAGYTSFRNIRRLGIDLVKIDGSFVKCLASSADDQAFVRMLIELARKLGLATVAEWVQDDTAATMLAGWGCDYLQGALIGTAVVTPPWRTPVSGGAVAQQR
jgi:diguanylate cyclase (GGDEF)-like protein